MIDHKTGEYFKAKFTALKLDEVSAVDDPANVHCTAVIQKRRDPLPPDMHRFSKKEEKPMQTEAVPFAKANATFMGRVNAIAARDGCALYLATQKARAEFPDEFAAVQKARFEADPDEEDEIEIDEEDVKAAAAEAAFGGKCREIAKRDAIPLYQATIKARTEHADLFEKAFG